ncbi:thioredoxin family protein [Kaistella yonginensis]|mgnify:CR=1 FL=1|uniref:thioredoxin family protein n=1 Tax=Kaistella yonginensis TaxID=658267 RepID=UPI0025B38E47|nr:thioredoxin family protein [Kaistella yonginensis]MDN3606876.1 thioredoxin family protein [Kaistella yonginensis]
MKPLTLFFTLFFIGTLMRGFSQSKIHPLENVENLQKTEKRNLLVFLHTDWCSYCKTMQNSTFKNNKVQDLLKEKFYFVALNGEEKSTIAFADAVFTYQPTGVKTGYHELALALGSSAGQVSYPTLVLLNPKHEIVFQHTGYMTAIDLLKILEISNIVEE